MKKLLLAAFAIVLGACASVQPRTVKFRPTYHYRLVEVERPQGAIDRYGEGTIAPVVEKGVTKHSFEDKLVRAVIQPIDSRMSLNLRNRTDDVIQIPWIDARIAGTDGKWQSIMHDGEKFSECGRQRTTAPWGLEKQSAHNDVLLPCSSVRFTYSTWFTTPLLPEMRVEAGDTARVRHELGRDVVGQRIRLLLPLQSDDVVYGYRFSFEITGFDFQPLKF